MKQILASFTALALLVGLCACSKKVEEPTWQEQYDLGVRYLSEGNYEEAILVFTAAIEIDPMQAETYEKLADAYLALGDVEMALQTLRDGYAATGDVRLQARIDELTAPDPTSEVLYTLWSDLKPKEITFLGHSIQNLDIWTIKAIMEENGFEVSEYDFGSYWAVVGNQQSITGHFEQIVGSQDKGDEYASWDYCGDQIAIGVRGIRLNDTLETVWIKLGVSNAHEAAAYVEEITAETHENGKLSKVITGSFDIYDANISADLLTIAMRIPWPDSQNDEHFSMFMNFCHKSDNQFVLTDCKIRIR